MKRIVLAVVVLLVAAAVWAQATRNRTGVVGGTTMVSLPYDVNAGQGYQGPISPTTQPMFDQFSWQTFWALNQPASSAAPNGPRIWETWASIDDVFHPNSETECAVSAARGAKTLRMAAKNEHVESESDFLEATQQPLIDENLNFVLYEIRMNDVERNYIVSNGLDTVAGHKAFTGMVNFPPSVEGKSDGSIEIKAAWKILGTNDDRTRYYTRLVNIAIPGSETVSGQPVCAENVLVGLIGMHIVRKTSMHPQWIWSSFEQVDNVPNAGPVPPSFFDPVCETCPMNAPPPVIGDEKGYLWGAAQPYAQRYGTSYGGKLYGTQVSRVYEIYPPTEAVTMAWWANPLLQGTRWVNYQLIGSQWRVTQETAPFAVEDIPNFLANTVMETYIQPQSSCLGCHEHATTSAGQCSDFSFVFAAAQAKQAGITPKSVVTANDCNNGDKSFRARKRPARRR